MEPLATRFRKDSAGGSDVYRDARLAYVRSQQRGVVEEEADDDEGAAVVEL